MPKRVAEEVPPRTSCGSRAAASRRLARTDRRRLRRPPITLSRRLPRATQRRAPGAVSVAGEPVVMMMYPLVREMATTTAPHRVPVAVTWSTGLGPVCSPPSGPDMGGVEDGAGDVDEAGVVETVQHGFVEAAPDASSRPDQEPAVGGRLRCAETGRQSVPGAATDQHVDDGREERLVRRVLRPAARGRTFDGGISGFAVSHRPSGTIQLHVPRPMPGSTTSHHVKHGPILQRCLS